MEEFEFLGVWWIPSEEAKAIPGTLSFTNQDGIKLMLMGSFKNSHEINEFKVYPIILGRTQEGKLISLAQCTEIGSQLGFGGSHYAKQRFMIGSVYIGFHFTNSQEISFHRIKLQYSYLPHCASLPPIRDKTILNEDGTLGKYELSYIPPDEIMAVTSKGTVTVTSSFQFNNDCFQGVDVHQSVWMQVETQVNLSFHDWLFQFIGPLQNLLTLGTCRPNHLLRLQGYTSKHSDSLFDGRVQELPIEIIFHQYYYDAKVAKSLHPPDMLFTLRDIVDNFSQIVENWLNVAEDLDSVCNLFFGIKYINQLYMEQKFLGVIQALEVYHRKRSNKQDLPEEGHKRRLDAIIAGTPQVHKKWLTDKLKYSNELSLRQRLKDLLNDSDRSQVIAPLINNRKVFIDKVVNTRNFLTHYDQAIKESAATTGEELYYLVQILTF